MLKHSAILGISAILLAGCGSSVGESGGASTEELANQRELRRMMAEQMQPTAEIYWDSVQYISDLEGEHDIFPQSDEEWAAVGEGADRIGELAAQLIEPRYSDGKGEDWMTFANALIEVSKQAKATTVAQDKDAVFEVGGTMYNICKSCHEAYITEEMVAAAAAEEEAKAATAGDAAE